MACFPSVSLRAWPMWPSLYWSVVDMPAQVFSKKFRHSQERYLVMWCKFHVVSMSLDFVIIFYKHPGIDISLYFSITYPGFWQARVRPVRFCLVQGAAGLHHAKEGSNSCFIYIKSKAFPFGSFYYSFLCTRFAGSICKCSRFVVMSNMVVIEALDS